MVNCARWIAVLVFSVGVMSAAARSRVVKGTVYRDGKPASGVHVTAHKSSGSYFTSFDGKYEVKIGSKSKWLLFTFPDKKEEKIELKSDSDILNIGMPPGKEAVNDAKGN